MLVIASLHYVTYTSNIHLIWHTILEQDIHLICRDNRNI